jgi:plastocyanin
VIDAFRYSKGGYSAFKGFPEDSMRPPVIRPGQSVAFTNYDAILAMPDTTPPLTKAGKTYTYFCRIHPFMHGSVRVKDKKRN